MSGPSKHLSWRELACHDYLQTPYPVDKRDRAQRLGDVFEALRSWLGDRPLAVLSAFRTVRHNQAVGGAARSRHVTGEAMDIRANCDVGDFHRRVNSALEHDATLKAHVGGIGLYPWGVHVDIRPLKKGGKRARWQAPNVGSRG